jgi:hypothetical protein
MYIKRAVKIGNEKKARKNEEEEEAIMRPSLFEESFRRFNINSTLDNQSELTDI